MQKVLISIDTEGPAGVDPVESLIYGKTKSGTEYGIRYLMDLMDKYGAKGLFFVDFAEAWDYGEEKIADVTRCIQERGHNVGVHLHPDHMSDKERRYLWQYGYDEQYEMISRCTELYKKITGSRPLSFRAGRYGADNNTLKILERLGYKYDMSEFYGNKYCKIDPPLCCNRMVRINDSNVVEVPVTSFRSFKNHFYSRFDKIDCAMDIHEFSRVMNKVCADRIVDVVSLFVHSFSVLDWRCDPDNPMLKKTLNNRLVKQLEWVKKNNNTVFISETDLGKIKIDDDKADIELDVSRGLLPYWFILKRGAMVFRDRMIRNV